MKPQPKQPGVEKLDAPVDTILESIRLRREELISLHDSKQMSDNAFVRRFVGLRKEEDKRLRAIRRGDA
jgi:hypothetical protein